MYLLRAVLDGRARADWSSAGTDTLVSECPPVTVCDRPLLLEFAHQGIRTRVPEIPGGRWQERTGGRTFFRIQSRFAVGRPVGKLKEEVAAARRIPGDICRQAYRPRSGPSGRGCIDRSSSHAPSRPKGLVPNVRRRRAPPCICHDRVRKSLADYQDGNDEQEDSTVDRHRPGCR